MGVGFGQEASGQTTGTPAANPFLNIVSIPSAAALPSRGYLVTSTGDLAFDERQQVGIDRFRFCCGHAVREALVGLQGSVLQQLGR